MLTRRAVWLAMGLAVFLIALQSGYGDAQRADRLSSQLLALAQHKLLALAPHGSRAKPILLESTHARATSEDLALWNAPTIPWVIGATAAVAPADEPFRARPLVLVEHAEGCAACGTLRPAFYDIRVFSQAEAFDFAIRLLPRPEDGDADAARASGAGWRVSVFDPAAREQRLVAAAENALTASQLRDRLVSAMARTAPQ